MSLEGIIRESQSARHQRHNHKPDQDVLLMRKVKSMIQQYLPAFDSQNQLARYLLASMRQEGQNNESGNNSIDEIYSILKNILKDNRDAAHNTYLKHEDLENTLSPMLSKKSIEEFIGKNMEFYYQIEEKLISDKKHNISHISYKKHPLKTHKF